MSPARKKRKQSKKKKARKQGASAASSRKLYTLTEISQVADISMPTLQKYKKQYAARIPSEGAGRRQRYPRSAIKVFKELKQENLAKRGRGRRRTKASRTPVKRAAVARKQTRRSAGASKLLSLQQIQKDTGISYPTLLRYVKLHLEKLPHVGTGRTRRYRRSAVPVFRRLRAQSPRGRRAAGASKPRAAAAGTGGVERRLAGLERAHSGLEKQLRELVQLLKKPVTVTLRSGS